MLDYHDFVIAMAISDFRLVTLFLAEVCRMRGKSVVLESESAILAMLN